MAYPPGQPMYMHPHPGQHVAMQPPAQPVTQTPAQPQAVQMQENPGQNKEPEKTEEPSKTHVQAKPASNNCCSCVLGLILCLCVLPIIVGGILYGAGIVALESTLEVSDGSVDYQGASIDIGPELSENFDLDLEQEEEVVEEEVVEEVDLPELEDAYNSYRDCWLKYGDIPSGYVMMKYETYDEFNAQCGALLAYKKPTPVAL